MAKNIFIEEICDGVLSEAAQRFEDEAYIYKKKKLINSTVLRTSRITSCKTAFRLYEKRPLVISTKAIFNMSG